MRRSSETFTALNGLRFLAALAVVVFHYLPRVDLYSGAPAFFKNLVNEGPCAVGFFFILSGFVLAHRYLQDGARLPSAASFYWARIVRLYPAYLLAFLLFTPIAVQRYLLHPSPELAGRHTFTASALVSLLMLQSWTPLAQSWNGPSWSLSVEAFMYLVFPIVGYRLLRLSRRQTLLLLSVCWLAPSILACAYVQHLIPGRIWHLYITNNPLLWTPLFLMGLGATRLLPAWDRLPNRTAGWLASLTFGGLILISLAWPHQWSDVFVTAGIAPFLVAVVICFTRREGWAARALGGSVFNKLGDVSYVIYILQAPLWHYWQPLTNILRDQPPQAGSVPLWQFIGFVPFLVVASFAVQHFIEIPLRQRLTAHRSHRAASPVLSLASP